MNDDMTRERLAQGVSELESRVGPPLPLAESLHKALDGAVFPLSARQLTWVARENEAPALVLSLLGSLPRASFGSVDAVARALEGDLEATVPQQSASSR
ncbi:DUF2795 domain-containing protein [Myxococcus xanthus]|nr:MULTISPECIES: DUF2795 domain-containing protein [Myxococcus]QZZ50395.1 hypothetical protein MyxoNM_14375 [Myxococcus xanthus]SDW91176.1 Protein of unknown function [Myxococcus xanthus]